MLKCLASPKCKSHRVMDYKLRYLELLRKNEFEILFEELLNSVVDGKYKNELYLLAGKYNGLRETIRLGTGGPEFVSIELNKLRSALIEIITSVPENQISEDKRKDDLIRAKLIHAIPAEALTKGTGDPAKHMMHVIAIESLGTYSMTFSVYFLVQSPLKADSFQFKVDVYYGDDLTNTSRCNLDRSTYLNYEGEGFECWVVYYPTLYAVYKYGIRRVEFSIRHDGGKHFFPIGETLLVPVEKKYS